MELFSIYQNVPEFETIKKSRGFWGDKIKMVKGEWSQSPYHSGYLTFAFSVSRNHKYCALHSVGVPSRLLCVARIDDTNIIEIISSMLHHLYLEKEYYIDMIEETYGNTFEQIFFNDVWKKYKSLIREAKK